MNRRIIYIVSGLVLGLALGIALFYGFPTTDEFSPSETKNPVIARSSNDQSVEGQGFSSRPRGLHEGLPAPDFALLDLNEQTVQLIDQRGKVVLLNFWATWCGPCQVEMPLFEDKYNQYRENDFVVLAVDFDEPVEDVQAFKEELDLTFPILLDPGGQVQRAYNILGYPTTVLIDREGLVHAIHVGIITEGQLSSYLGELGVVE